MFASCFAASASPLHQTLQQSRGSARTALTYLQQFERTTSATHQAEMYFIIAFDEMPLAEDFCDGYTVAAARADVAVLEQDRL